MPTQQAINRSYSLCCPVDCIREEPLPVPSIYLFGIYSLWALLSSLPRVIQCMQQYFVPTQVHTRIREIACMHASSGIALLIWPCTSKKHRIECRYRWASFRPAEARDTNSSTGRVAATPTRGRTSPNEIYSGDESRTPDSLHCETAGPARARARRRHHEVSNQTKRPFFWSPRHRNGQSASQKGEPALH